LTYRKAKRILIVEDEFLVAMLLGDLLTEMGHHVIGPCSRVEEAMELVREGNIDFAVLDINLAGARSFPVADILRQCGISFVFASGYGIEGLVDGYRDEAILRKPYEVEEVRRVIAQALPGSSRLMRIPRALEEGQRKRARAWLPALCRRGIATCKIRVRPGQPLS
jgi:DNA-binding NtrC family response regulator